MKKRWRMKRRRVKLRIRQRRQSIDKIFRLTKEEEEGKVFVSFIFIYIERNEAERNTI
jgi:hypothetical protein